MQVSFNNQQYEVVPTHDPRQWYMTIDEVAKAYGVQPVSIHSHLQRHEDELRDGVEKGYAICMTPGGPQQVVVVFREGIIKLGFFVRSPQAAAFRQFATDLIVQHLESQGVVTPAHFQEFMSEIRGIVGGLKLEVDELREQLGLFVDWDDQERREIQAEINITKTALNKAGTYVIGKVRAMLGVSGIYGRNIKVQVINCLRNMRGEGLHTVT